VAPVARPDTLVSADRIQADSTGQEALTRSPFRTATPAPCAGCRELRSRGRRRAGAIGGAEEEESGDGQQHVSGLLGAGGVDPNILRPDDHGDARGRRRARRARPCRRRCPLLELHRVAAGRDLAAAATREAVAAPHEIGDERGRRTAIDLLGGSDLLDRPRCMTATASDIENASSWSCVTYTKRDGELVLDALSWPCMSRRSLRSSAPSGSSSSSTLGR